MYLFEFSLKQGGGTGGWYYPLDYNIIKFLFSKQKNKKFKKILKIKSEYNNLTFFKFVY